MVLHLREAERAGLWAIFKVIIEGELEVTLDSVKFPRLLSGLYTGRTVDRIISVTPLDNVQIMSSALSAVST